MQVPAGALTAYDGDRVVAYLVPRDDGSVGYGEWDGDPVAVRGLYARAAEAWARRGIARHVVYAPVPGEPFLSLGFGIEQVYASRDLSPIPRPPGIEVRLAGPEDLDAIVSLADVVGRYQRESPVFADVSDEFFEQLPESHAETLAEAEGTYFLAYDGGRLAGMALFAPGEPGPMAPPGTVELVLMAVPEAMRGRGAGVAMTAAGVDWARDAGFVRCHADWRSANPLSSAFWPRRGFEPFAVRLVRRLEPGAVDRLASSGG